MLLLDLPATTRAVQSNNSFAIFSPRYSPCNPGSLPSRRIVLISLQQTIACGTSVAYGSLLICVIENTR